MVDCPECGCERFERVHTEYYPESVEVVRHCEECPCQYVVAYGNAIVMRVDET